MSRRRRNITVTKANGGREYFSRQKLMRSLRRSGLSPARSNAIADQVTRELYEGARTKDIYRRALQLVKEVSPVAAVQYSLKKAIFDLGPTGHHFETFVARYFEALGFSTKTCQVIKGKFVSHEIDVIATKNGKTYFVECKFHNRHGIKNDIKIALYVKARWDDLREGHTGKNLTGFFLASNTAFTTDAITYANGTNLHLLGVNAPLEKSFLQEIKELGLYPVTSLRGLSKIIRNELLNKNIVLASELIQQKKILLQLGMTEADFAKVIREVEILQGKRI